MKTKIDSNFKAVDFMRKVRNELSDLYHTNKELYRSELKKAMSDFVKTREGLFKNKNIVEKG